MHYIVAYDIEQDRRRQKVLNALKDYGLRVQYSVFECDLTAAKLIELRERVRPLIDPRKDKLVIYPMCEACFFRSESLGKD